MSKTGRPGTMLYFDLLEDLEDYTDVEAGQLLRAMLRYGTTGEVPFFTDRGMKTIWRKVQEGIDRDEVAYENAVTQRKYATYCRKMRKADQEPLSYDDWLNGSTTTDNEPLFSNNENNQLLTPTVTSTSTVTLTSALAGADSYEREVEGGGEKKREQTPVPVESAGRFSPRSESEFEDLREAALKMLEGAKR